MRREFRMPDAGRGPDRGRGPRWRVAAGDEVVEVNQVLLEVETAKAAVELPSPYAGRVLELLVAEGETVAVGDADHRRSTRARPARPPASGPRRWGRCVDRPPTLTRRPTSPGQTARGLRRARDCGIAGLEPTRDARRVCSGRGEPKREAVLVGYGVRQAGTPRRRPRLGPARRRPAGTRSPGRRAKPVRHGGLEQARAVEQRLAEGTPRAKPPVRRLARDLGVDLADVVPTGPRGSITHDDVSLAAQRRSPRGGADRTPTLAAGRRAGGGPSRPGRFQRVVDVGAVAGTPMAGLRRRSGSRCPTSRRMMAKAMTASAFTAPHVTEWVDVDVTAMTGSSPPLAHTRTGQGDRSPR